MSDSSKWKRARLIPVAGIKGDREAEMRATSAFLAVLSIVRDLSHELLTPMGASSAAKAVVETYTEIALDSRGKSVRPDGVICVTYGKRSFTALVEVKTGDNKLDKDQINAYWQSARQAGYDHVVTISNEIAPSGAHPVDGLRVQKNSPVQVSHLSWSRILATALRLKNHTGVDDPEQAWILGELVRYLKHDASGVLPLADMGSSWTEIRDGARAGTLQRRTAGLRDVALKIDEMHTFAALKLSTEIGEDVDVIHPKVIRDRPARIDSFVRSIIEGEAVIGQIRIPHTAGDISTEVDLRAQQMTACVEVKAPEDKGARGRVGWIVSQLGNAHGEIVIEAYAKNARVPISASLDSVREDRRLLLGAQGDEPNRFLIKRRSTMPLGRKSTSGRLGFVDGYLALLTEFYEGVVQDLTPWQPPAPKRKASVEAGEAETPLDDLAWSPGE